MDTSLIDWPSAIGQVVLVVLLSFVVMCAITSFVRFQLMAERAVESEELGSSVDRDFRLAVMNQIAACRRQRQPLTVAMVRLPPDGPDENGALDLLRSGLRSTDVVMACGERLVGLLLLCGSENTPAVVERLGRQFAALAGNFSAWRFGVAGYPDHGYKTSVIYNRALAMIDDAASRGVPVAGMLPPEEAETAPDPAIEKLRDPLTGLIREDQMIPIMRRFVARERKADRPVSMVYFDIDQPERLVDQYGRPAVEAMMKELSAFLDRHYREQDMLASFGPHGFVLGLAATPDAAMQAAQRVMTDVRKMAFRAGPGMKISISAGVAGFPDVLGTAVHYVVAAEAALQHARKRGRNQCVRYEPSMNVVAEGEKQIDQL